MIKPRPYFVGGFGPDALPVTEAGVERPALTDPLAHGAWRESEGISRSLDFRAELFAECLHGTQHNEKFRTAQRESSHSHPAAAGAIKSDMSVDATFRAKLIEMREAQGLSRAELSRRAGLNLRAVTDIEEGKAISPKISTAFALAQALKVDPGEMLGLGPRLTIRQELAMFLAQYSEDEQGKLLAALEALPLRPSE